MPAAAQSDTSALVDIEKRMAAATEESTQRQRVYYSRYGAFLASRWAVRN